MKFFIVLFLFSSKVFSHGLPSHYGSEFGVAIEGEYQNKIKPNIQSTQILIDMTSSKLLKEKLYLTAVSTFGKNPDLGLSVFYKVAKNLYLGGKISADYNFDFAQHFTLLYSFNTGKKSKIEPFFTYEIEKKTASEIGVRYYLEENVAITLGLYSQDLLVFDNVSFRFKLAVPVHDFGVLDSLMSGDFFKDKETKKEISKLKGKL